MLKSFLLGGAILIAAPALAQTRAAPAPANTAQPAAAVTPSSTTAQQPTAAATPATAATPSAQAAPAAGSQPTNPASAVASVVESDWTKYDTDSNGQLSKAEFGKWMDALREQNPAQKAAVKDPTAWTNAAFTQADKDKSGSISKAELEAFLKG